MTLTSVCPFMKNIRNVCIQKNNDLFYFMFFMCFVDLMRFRLIKDVSREIEEIYHPNITPLCQTITKINSMTI